jgi:membrane-associated phospholipid phosphatase
MKPTRVVTVVAHPMALMPAAAVTALVFHRRPGVAPRLLIAAPFGWAASRVLKKLFPRRKPKVVSSAQYESFPSGHATVTTAFACSLVDAFKAWRAIPIAVAAIAIVDASRVHDREHRVSEVLVGNAIGLAGAAIASVLARKLHARLAGVQFFARRADRASESSESYAVNSVGGAVNSALRASTSRFTTARPAGS